MKEIKKEVKSLTKELKALTQKAEKIVKALEKLEKPQAKPKAVKKAVKPKKAVKKPAVKKTAKKPTENKTPKNTVLDALMAVIRASKKGVSVVQIIEQTGLKKGQIWPTINRVKRHGTVKIVKKAIYVKA